MLTEVALPAEVIDPAWVRVVEALPVNGGELEASHGGLTWEGPSTCTVGFTWKVPGVHFGNATAAHCADGWRSARDEYWIAHDTTVASWNDYEECDTLDLQYQRTSYSVGHLARDQKYHQWFSLWDKAGWYYIGQYEVVFGQTSGALWNQVQDFGNFARPTGFDCPNSGTISGLKVGSNTTGGDSGGTYALSYGGKLYLAGHHSFGVGTSAVGTWIGYVPIPPGGHICVEVNPC